MTSVRANALKMLHLIYTASRDDSNDPVRTDHLLGKAGLSQSDAAAALKYLIQRRLVEDQRIVGPLPTVLMTADGIDHVEQAEERPDQETRFFPPFTQVFNYSAYVGDMRGGVIQQGVQHSSTTQINHLQVNLPELAEQLMLLRNALQQEAKDPEQFVALGHVAAAELAAKEGDEEKVRSSIRTLSAGAGKWVADKAAAVGVSLVSAYLKSGAGL